MYSTLQSIHSYWAYAVLILLILAAANGLLGWLGSKTWTPAKDRKISFFGMLASHIQLLIGVIVLFLSPYWEVMTTEGMGTIMKDSTLRLYVVEHPTINILAIILITIGWSRHKRASSDTARFKSIGVFYSLGLLFLLSRIPWQAWMS